MLACKCVGKDNRAKENAMNTLCFCIATALLGIDVGWQRMPEGGMEYIIQLDAQTMESLRMGRAVQSDIPPAAGPVRSYRIIVGSKPLPHEAPPIAHEALSPDPNVKKLSEHTAIYSEPKPTPQTPNIVPAIETSLKEPTKPWLPLIYTLLGLFASLGANAFLGWIAWDYRRQWHLLRNNHLSMLADASR
jgi:hypothetical protein